MHKESTYKDAKKDLERFSSSRKRKKPVDDGYVPPIRTSSGIRFGYYKSGKKGTQVTKK